MRYDFRCGRGHVTELSLPMERRDSPQKCPTCARLMTRQLSLCGIKGEHESKQMLEVEREAWALATGENHRTPAELSAWCAAHGKSVVGKGWKPKVDNEPSDREIEKAVDAIYQGNHSLGEIRK